MLEFHYPQLKCALKNISFSLEGSLGLPSLKQMLWLMCFRKLNWKALSGAGGLRPREKDLTISILENVSLQAFGSP